LKETIAQKRRILKRKMAKAVAKDIESLSPPMQSIFVDDLICAFENRLKVLASTKSGIEFSVNSERVLVGNTQI
jgi:hypothetical protein